MKLQQVGGGRVQRSVARFRGPIEIRRLLKCVRLLRHVSQRKSGNDGLVIAMMRGVRHSQRLDDVLIEKIAERSSRCFLDDEREQVVIRTAVAVANSRLA